MFSTNFNPSANMGFGDRFKLNQAYSPTLSKSDLTPGMIQLMQQPMPTPAGGAAPGMPMTANGIGGGSVPPGAAGSMSPPGMMMQGAQPQPGQVPGVPAFLAQAPNMQQQAPSGGNGGVMPPGAMAQLAQLGGGLLNRSQPQAMMAPPQVAPMSGMSGNNGALQKLLGMYGIHGGLLGV
jgi:hypothetical protein